MTLKEATEAAERRDRVVYRGIEYLRITEAGYHYNEKGVRSPFVQLLDRTEHSVTYADPRLCDLKEKPKCVICGGEIEGHGNDARPVAEGRCCDTCNMTVVVPERIKEAKNED